MMRQAGGFRKAVAFAAVQYVFDAAGYIDSMPRRYKDRLYIGPGSNDSTDRFLAIRKQGVMTAFPMRFNMLSAEP